MRSKGKGQQSLLGEFNLKLHPKNERKLLAKIGKFNAEQSGAILNADERKELLKLRKEVKELRMEKEILKKASSLLLRETK